MPNFGDKVLICPAPAHVPEDAKPGAFSRVLADAMTGRFLSIDGEEVTWNAHHAERLRSGEIIVMRRGEPMKLSPGMKVPEIPPADGPAVLGHSDPHPSDATSSKE